MRTLSTFFLASLLLSGCAATVSIPSSGSYPAPVPNFGQYEKFPAALAGYRRGAVTAYAPALADYSIAYDRNDATLQNAVTLYFYPRLQDTAAQLRVEEAEVLKAHPGGRVLSRRTMTLESNGASYEATLVTFEFRGALGGLEQKLTSQMLVAFPARGTFKVRSTEPASQQDVAEHALQQLLMGVAWAQ